MSRTKLTIEVTLTEDYRMYLQEHLAQGVTDDGRLVKVTQSGRLIMVRVGDARVSFDMREVCGPVADHVQKLDDAIGGKDNARR